MGSIEAQSSANNVSNGQNDHLESQTIHEISALAQSLVKRTLATYNIQYGFSTASCQVYDTAWVAMVTKTTSQGKEWLFPESFHYLLGHQAQDGSWGIDTTSQTVGILDTAAALLALLRHASEPLQVQDYSADELSARICSASRSLDSQLQAWTDISSANHIGVELIMPALLEYLQREDSSLRFEFKSRVDLNRMAAEKLARFQTDMLYEARPTSALHSLEAFIGKIDFDRVSHHLFGGSMMASPSSTAAYLMNVSKWDDEAEGYLRHVVEAGTGHGDGGVAGTFPIHYFEFNWVMATLLEAGFDVGGRDESSVQGIASIVKKGFVQDRGVIGFAPRAIDVDDTAKGLLALKRLGRQEGVSPDVMIKVFEKDDGFATFGGERDRSVSSNCHVLMALLEWGDRPRYSSQIRKAATFVCNHWWSHDKRFKDKWHLSHLYPTMLMVEAFSTLLRDMEKRPDDQYLDTELVQKVAVALFQASMRTLFEQRSNGSWEGSPEQTAYAILTLAEARHFYLCHEFDAQLKLAIHKGNNFLNSSHIQGLQRLWTSKTSYSVKLVFEAYILAARKKATDIEPPQYFGSTLGLANSLEKTLAHKPIMQKATVFSTMDDVQLRASFVEAALFVPFLQAGRSAVFPRYDMKVAKEKYLELIPFTWVGSNNRSKHFVPNTLLLDLMYMAQYLFYSDEFFESTVATAFEDTASGAGEADLHTAIDRAITVAVDEVKLGSAMGLSSGYGQILEPLKQLSSWFLQHADITAASPWDRAQVEQEFRNLMHSSGAQVADNANFVQQRKSGPRERYSTSRSLYEWVHMTGGDHLAACAPMYFVSAWVSQHICDGAEAFPTPAEKYFLKAIERHVSAASRMQNDFGSCARDLDEGNVNCVFFPEFARTASRGLTAQKGDLWATAKFEEDCLWRAMDALEKAAYDGTADVQQAERKLRVIKFFVDVADLYNQVYVARDMGSRLLAKEGR